MKRTDKERAGADQSDLDSIVEGSGDPFYAKTPDAPHPEHAQEGALTEEQEGVMFRLNILEPGDHELLATVLRENPEIREQILAFATANLGNDTVAKALAILNGHPVITHVDEDHIGGIRMTAPPKLTPDQEGVLFRMAILEPGDSKLLGQILKDNPDIHDQIVAQATRDLGEATVKEALAIARGEGPKEEPPTEVKEQVEQPEPTPPDVVQESAKEQVQKPEAKEPEPEPKVEEPGWVVRARAFNQTHSDLAWDFNQCTLGSCMGADGVLDPNLVAKWQADHNVPPDGRVGPHTLDAARIAMEAMLLDPTPEQSAILDDPTAPTWLE